MRDIVPGTTSELKMSQAIQNAIGAKPNGILGNQTLSDIARVLKAKCFPLTLQLYSIPTIIAEDLTPFKGQSTVSAYANSMSGSFTYPSGKLPCSILISNGVVIRMDACHAHIKCPETVIYRDRTGLHYKRCMSVSDLPKDTIWAVGGMGLMGSYDPAAEGFSGEYSDVLRKTAHTVLGVKGGLVYGFYFSNHTAASINSLLKTNQMCDYAILLDGGHLAAMNGSEAFSKINTRQLQGYLIQFR